MWASVSGMVYSHCGWNGSLLLGRCIAGTARALSKDLCAVLLATTTTTATRRTLFLCLQRPTKTSKNNINNSHYCGRQS
eukprot:1418148-Amphidinium_carterae.1